MPMQKTNSHPSFSIRLFPSALLLLFSFLLLSSCSQRTESTAIIPAASDSSASPLITINEQLKNDPNNASLYYRRAQLYFENKEAEASLNDLLRALSIDSSNADFYLLLADVHFIKKEGIKAKEALARCLALDPDNAEAYLKLAEMYFLVEQYGQSLEQINKALKIDMHNARAYFMKGMNYKYMGDTANAISSMQTAVEQDNEYYDAYMQLAILHGAKDDSLAVSYYDNALRITPQSVEALYGKALFLQEHGYPERALMEYDKMLEIDKNNPLAYFNSGYVYLVYLEKLQDALAMFTKAIELNPRYVEAWTNRGVTYEKSGNLKNAENDFRKALEIKPDYTPAAKGISRVVDKDYR